MVRRLTWSFSVMTRPFDLFAPLAVRGVVCVALVGVDQVGC
jgi:hypothetical protein